jgi:hypothetical protein
MSLLPEDPRMRRITILQLSAFVGIPVVMVFALLILLLSTGVK